MKPIKVKLVMTAPEGKNYDPSIHSDIERAELGVCSFAVLAEAAYSSRRKNGNATTSHATAAKACGVSVSQVRRERETLVAKGFLRISATSRGRTNTYELTSAMRWGERGSKLWLPEELWALNLNPYELRLYAHYICEARGTGRVVADRDTIAERCHISPPKQRSADAGLIAAGLIELVGYTDKRPVFELRPNTEWVSLQDRKATSYAEAKRNVRTGLAVAQKETSEQGEAVKRNVRTGKKKPQSIKSNALIQNLFNAEKSFEVGKPATTDARTLFEELVGRNAFGGFCGHIKNHGAEPHAELVKWLEKFGEPVLRKAWGVIQTTETAADTGQYARHGKNFRLIAFCRGELDGTNDPGQLCGLHTKATVTLLPAYQPLPERLPCVPLSFVPRGQRCAQAVGALA